MQVNGLTALEKKKVILSPSYVFQASQVALVIKNLPANADCVRDKSSIPGSGLQIYCRGLSTQGPPYDNGK